MSAKETPLNIDMLKVFEQSTTFEDDNEIQNAKQLIAKSLKDGQADNWSVEVSGNASELRVELQVVWVIESNKAYRR